MSLADALATAADIAGGLAKTPGHVGIVGGIAAVALKAGAAIARAGKDPVVEITRILSATPEVAAVHDEWDALIKRTFTTKSEPPAAGDGSDLYDEVDDHGKDEDTPP